jgi:hypothetical protein
VARHLPRFQAARAPEPDDWAGWLEVLTDNSGPEGTEINVPPRGGFGTVSSSLIALAAGGEAAWRFAAGPPHAAAFNHVVMAQ